MKDEFHIVTVEVSSSSSRNFIVCYEGVLISGSVTKDSKACGLMCKTGWVTKTVNS